MGDMLDDLVLDFDLNYLEGASNHSVIPGHSKPLKPNIQPQQRPPNKKNLLLKQKLVVTNTLIKKYHENAKLITETQNLLFASKEECRKVCIDYKNALEKIAYVEKEFEILKNQFLSEKSKLFAEKNNTVAIESYAKQLQLLLKERDDLIESVKEECKVAKAHLKESEKTNALLKKEKEVLSKNIQHLANLVFLKKTTLNKTDKALVAKYRINNENHDGIDSLYEDISSGSEFDDIDELSIPTAVDDFKEANTKKITILSDVLIAKNIELEHITKKDYNVNDHDSDVGSEVVSLDTGRGSSLEFSDSEKCINSPDYFSADSPLSIDLNNKKQGDAVESSITVKETNETLKSPIPFGRNNTSAEQNKKGLIFRVDRAVSPINYKTPAAKIFVDKAVNTVKVAFVNKSTTTSPIHEGSIFGEITTAKIVQETVTPVKLPVPTQLTPRRGINKGSIFDDIPTPKPVDDKDPIKLPLACKNASRSIQRISLFDEIPNSKTAVDEDVISTKLPLSSQKAAKHDANKKQSMYDEISAPTSMVTAGQKLAKGATNKGSIFDEIRNVSPIKLSPASEKETRLTEDIVSLLHEVSAPKPADKADSLIKNTPGGRNVAKRAIDMDYLFDELPTPKTTVDSAVSPIKLRPESRDTATSPIKLQPVCKDTAESPIKFPRNNAVSGYLSANHQIPIKECLELNDRNNLCNSDDTEIEMILNTMRFTHEVITPIPPTPTIPVRTRSKVLAKANKHTDNEVSELLRESKEQANVGHLVKKVRNTKKLPYITFKCQKNKKIMEDCNIRDVNGENKTASYIKLVNADSELITIIEVIEDPTSSEESGIIEEYKENTNNNSSKRTLSNTFDQEKEVEDVGDESLSRQNTDTIDEIGNKSIMRAKPKKLTRLQKLRKTLIPQSKIKKDVLPPARKLRARIEQLQINKKKAKASELKVTLSSDEAYQKAVKIMAELKLKENTTKVKTINGKKRHSMPSSLVSKIDNENNGNETHVANCILTRSRIKRLSLSHDKDAVDVLSQTKINETMNEFKLRDKVQVKDDAEMPPIFDKKRSKCTFVDKPIELSTRILRSYSRRMSEESESERCESDTTDKVTQKCQSLSVPKAQSDSHKSEVVGIDKIIQHNNSPLVSKTQSIPENANSSTELVDYNDLGLFDDEPCPKKIKIHENNNNNPVQENNNVSGIILNPQDSVLCKMIDRYGIKTIKNMPKKIPESVIKAVSKKLEDGIAHIIKLPMSDTKNAMNKLANDMQRWTWKDFLRGLILYLMEPTRKLELYNKINAVNAPSMTNSEQVLLYIVTRLRACWQDVDLFDCIFSQIEYTLFKLNNAPEFDAIESLSHFYAILCKYVKAKNRLRIFVLDAMYCLQYKAVPLIKQCIEVWFHILPLAHLGIAKSPLVTCVVYLLHYYKCEDKFNRVQDIRHILHHKYYFNITDWNETRILEMFKHAIHELRDNPVERKMMRLALIILAKRQGPQWCQNKLIKNILLPVIDGSQADVSDIVKAFCVSMLGPLLKPYPMDMKVHCEIILNQLLDMLDHNHSPRVQEAIYSSLISMSKHNQTRVIQALLSWHPQKISTDAENIIKCYVKEKPVRVWKTILSKISLVR